ncbi:hypothetical protein Tco_0845368 [Tanacetum coccineum]
MANLKFADTHNMVVFLSKPTKSEGFEQIVDFLNAHPIKYALTINPTIYISCIEQFWSTSVVKTINEEVQLHALVDDKKIIISEASVRRDLKLEDEENINCLPNSIIFEQLALIGYEKISQKLTFYKPLFSPQWKFLIHTVLQCLSPKTTAWNEFSNTMASAIICLATNQKFRFVQVFLDKQLDGMSTHNGIYIAPSHTKKIFGNMRRVGKGFSGRVTLLFPTMVVQNQAELGEDEAVHKELGDSLVRAVTTASSLEAEQDSVGGPRCQETIGDTIAQTRFENVSRTVLMITAHNRVESSGDEENLGEDASKQGRRINVIDADEDITLVNDNADKEMFDVDALNSEEVLVAGKNENVVEEIVDASQIVTEEITLAQALADLKSTKPKAKGIAFREPGESTTTILSHHNNYRTKLDEEIALKLQAEIDKEERIARAKEEKIDEANIALTKEWDDIQAKIEADHELAQRLQAEDKKSLDKDQQDQWTTLDCYYGMEFERQCLNHKLKMKVGSMQQRYKVLSWKLFDSCGVHCLSLQSGMIYMLVEKRYPLTPPTITDMLNKKLQVDYFSEMAYQLLKLLTKQLKNQ